MTAKAAEFLSKTIQCGDAQVQIFITQANQITADSSKLDSSECESGDFNEQLGMPICKLGSEKHIVLSSVTFSNIARVRYEVSIGSKISGSTATLFGESLNEYG